MGINTTEEIERQEMILNEATKSQGKESQQKAAAANQGDDEEDDNFDQNAIEEYARVYEREEDISNEMQTSAHFKLSTEEVSKGRHVNQTSSAKKNAPESQFAHPLNSKDSPREIMTWDMAFGGPGTGSIGRPDSRSQGGRPESRTAYSGRPESRNFGARPESRSQGGGRPDSRRTSGSRTDSMHGFRNKDAFKGSLADQVMSNGDASSLNQQ